MATVYRKHPTFLSVLVTPKADNWTVCFIFLLWILYKSPNNLNPKRGKGTDGQTKDTKQSRQLDFVETSERRHFRQYFPEKELKRGKDLQQFTNLQRNPHLHSHTHAHSTQDLLLSRWNLPPATSYVSLKSPKSHFPIHNLQFTTPALALAWTALAQGTFLLTRKTVLALLSRPQFPSWRVISAK